MKDSSSKREIKNPIGRIIPRRDLAQQAAVRVARDNNKLMVKNKHNLITNTMEDRNNHK